MKRCVAMLLCMMLCLSGFRFTGTATEENTIAVQNEVLLSALLDADIASMREALELGLVTSEMLTAYYLERIETYNKTYNCFITICDDAMETAKERDKQIAAGQAEGLLFGIPVVIKDNMDLEGYHTTNGYKKKDKQIADSNAEVVAYLLQQGAVIVAKTNMSTAAQDALRSYSEAAGETKNAYDHHLSAGGSSGGSAVAVSLNFAAAGLGTDTNSSLRIPAALNGCIALRPTFGLLSLDGIKTLNSTRDTPGAITRTVYDQAIMLDVLTGGTYRYTENLNANILEGMRIGVLTQLSYTTTQDELRTEENIDDEVEVAFENTIRELEACGAEVVPVSIPKFFSLSNATFSSGSQAKKDALYKAFLKTLEQNNISVMIYPTYLSTPLCSGVDETGMYWSVYDQLWINNCKYLSPSASLPEITVPIGTHSLGAGIGMEIAAPRNCEQLLLDIAYSYTSRYDHRTVPSGAPDAYAAHNSGNLRQVMDDYKRAVEEAQKEPEIVEPVEPQETLKPEVEENTPPEKMSADISVYWLLGALGVLLIGLSAVLLVMFKRRSRKYTEETTQV